MRSLGFGNQRRVLASTALSLLTLWLATAGTSAAATAPQFGATGATATPAQRPAMAQTNSIVTLPAPVAPAVSTEPYLWTAAKAADGSIRITGAVPAQSLQRFQAVRAGDSLRDETEVRDGAPDDFVANVRQALDLLAILQSGEIVFDGTDWTARGIVAPTNTEEGLLALLDTDSNWTTDLDLSIDVPPASTPAIAGDPAATVENAEPSPAPEPEPAEPTPVAVVDEAARTTCTATLAELSAHNAILFQSGAAVIADSAAAELDAFAQALAGCPGSEVNVEGHTDSDGDDRQNLVLSVMRAEAVVSALVERGVDADLLYAIGFGESQPVADNATADGKRQNRRIVISLRAPTNP